MPKTRKSHPPSLKAKVAVEAIKAHKTAAQIAQMFGVHPTQVGGWKKQALAGLPDIFGNGREQVRQQSDAEKDELYKQIGGRQAETGFHRVGEFPTEHETAVPIHHGNQVEEAAMHRNVRNIGAPDLIGPFDLDATQQVRVDLVTCRRTAQVRFRIKSFDTQNTHQPLNALAVDFQRDRHAAAAEERVIHVQLVEPPEQSQVLRALWPRLVVVGRARQPE